MTFRLTLIASAILFSAAVAQAHPAPVARVHPTPASTDEARAMAGSVLPVAESASSVIPAGPASTTDDARAMAGRSLPATSPLIVSAPVIVISTDQARALTGASARAAKPADQSSDNVTSALPCGCKRG
jgi:hypothetical protein